MGAKSRDIWRKKNPVKYAYQSLKNNAKRRGKVFELTLEQFKEFAIKTRYMAKRGIYKNSYHIDRIDEAKGYTIDNIQVLTNSENIKKSMLFRGKDENNKPIIKTGTTKKRNFDDVPF